MNNKNKDVLGALSSINTKISEERNASAASGLAGLAAELKAGAEQIKESKPVGKSSLTTFLLNEEEVAHLFEMRRHYLASGEFLSGFNTVLNKVIEDSIDVVEGTENIVAHKRGGAVLSMQQYQQMSEAEKDAIRETGAIKVKMSISVSKNAAPISDRLRERFINKGTSAPSVGVMVRAALLHTNKMIGGAA